MLSLHSFAGLAKISAKNSVLSDLDSCEWQIIFCQYLIVHWRKYSWRLHVLTLFIGGNLTLFPLALFPFFFSHPRSTITLILTLSSIYFLPSFIGNLSTTIATLRCLGPPRRGLIFNKNLGKFGLDYKIRKNTQLLKAYLDVGDVA